MKTNANLALLIPLYRSVLLLCIILVPAAVASQVYKFRDPDRISGTNLHVGAVYRFSNVKSGTDALVKINDMTHGATLAELDRTSDGYDDAFQPSVTVPASRDGYVEFVITFVKHNTSTPQVQNQFGVSGVDIDGVISGSRRLYEFVAFNLGGGLADFDVVSGELSIQHEGSFFTGKNITGFDYSGIDTAQTAFMFSTMNANITAITVRAGSDNNLTSSQTRNASIYFKQFSYPNSAILPVAAIVNFSGVDKEEGICLAWALSSPEYVTSVVPERSSDGIHFNALANLQVPASAVPGSAFTYTDVFSRAGNKLYYRLKAIVKNGREQYSNILVFPVKNAGTAFRLYPTIVTNAVTVQFKTEKEAVALVQLSGYTGNMVYSRRHPLQKGINNFSMDIQGNVAPGTYILTVKTPAQTYSQQIIIRR